MCVAFAFCQVSMEQHYIRGDVDSYCCFSFTISHLIFMCLKTCSAECQHRNLPGSTSSEEVGLHVHHGQPGETVQAPGVRATHEERSWHVDAPRVRPGHGNLGPGHFQPRRVDHAHGWSPCEYSVTVLRLLMCQPMPEVLW